MSAIVAKMLLYVLYSCFICCYWFKSINLSQDKFLPMFLAYLCNNDATAASILLKRVGHNPPFPPYINPFCFPCMVRLILKYSLNKVYIHHSL